MALGLLKNSIHLLWDCPYVKDGWGACGKKIQKSHGCTTKEF
jgi:hypothetical protein